MTVDVCIFQVLSKHGSTWKLLDSFKKRDDAIAYADKLWAKNDTSNNSIACLKVNVETFDTQANQFVTETLLSYGAEETAAMAPQSQKAALAICQKPSDLYSMQARGLITKYLSMHLEDQGITTSELIHSAQQVAILRESQGRMSDCIHRIAIEIKNDWSVQKRINHLDGLILKAEQQLTKTSGELDLDPDTHLSDAGDALSDIPDSVKAYCLSIMLTTKLAAAADFTEKARILLTLLKQIHHSWIFNVVDAMLAEQLAMHGVLDNILGNQQNRSHFILLMAHLQCGLLSEEILTQFLFDDPELLSILNINISREQLPQTAAVLGAQIEENVQTSRKFHADGLLPQLQFLHTLKNFTPNLDISDYQKDKLTIAIETRLVGIISGEAVNEDLAAIKDPFDKIEHLLEMEKLVDGAANKRMVANFMMPVLTGFDNRDAFTGKTMQPTHAMQRLVNLQKLLHQSRFNDIQISTISERLDMHCREILESTLILERLMKQSVPASEKINRLEKLIGGGYLTKGQCTVRAQQKISYLQRPSTV